MLKNLPLSIIFISIFSSQSYAVSDVPRWYSSQLQAKGSEVFKQNCAVCHGANAESTPNWKQKNAQGQYPPPPLNGSAHAWHHSLDILRQSVREGGVKIGGLMPSFENRLTPQERDSAIAFFQSQWTDELYLKWSENFKVPPLKVSENKASSKNPIVNRLSKRLNSSQIDSVINIANKQLVEVKTQGKTIYLTPDGRYAIIGKLIDLETGKNLSKAD